MGLNNRGEVVGYSLTVSGQTRAYWYHGGTMTNLGLLSPSHGLSMALDINESSVIVGVSTDVQHVHPGPFVYSGGTMTLVGSLGGNYGLAQGINDAGQIVGISADSNNITHAFESAGGSMTDLGSFPGSFDYSNAFGINNLGAITGYSATAQDVYEAFLYDGGSLQPLGTLGGTRSRGFAINDSDQVVGASFVDDIHERAFLWHNGSLTDLGVTAGAVTSQALDINNGGHVVGTLVLESSGALNRGFIYRDGQMIDLNTLIEPSSGWVLRDAQGINDRGQIVGFGEINGQQHAYLLTPVPEPSTLIPWAVAAGVLMFCLAIKSHRPMSLR
jgi:probable HAF family extracellular repeat protein